MFEKSRLQDALVQYKKNFVSKQWVNEKYKWEAVKCFRDNWNVNASDFAGMLERSLAKTYNLLRSKNNFPAAMITKLAKSTPEEVRAMFISLFDESSDVYERINDFKVKSSDLLKQYYNFGRSHYQSENPISVYLWLRFPDKYYIYKYSEIKTVAKELKYDYHFKKGAYANNIRYFYKFYDELREEIQKDAELINLFRSQLTDTCYPDPQLRTLTADVGFYISRYYSQPETPTEWFPTDYEPGITEDMWIDLLNDGEIFTQQSLEIMKRLKDYGGEATCTQLSVKYGETKNFYNTGSSSLAERVANKTECPVMRRENGNPIWWAVLYLGRNAGENEEGSYVWKLRSELSAALDKIDLNHINLQAQSEPGEKNMAIGG